MIEWLNYNSGAVIAIATCLLVAVTLAYVVLTQRISKHTAEQVNQIIKDRKIALHREMCETIYIPMRDWLLRREKPEAIIEDQFFYSGYTPWNDLKYELPHLIYHPMNRGLVDRISDIDSLLVKFNMKDREGKYCLRLKNIVADVLYPTDKKLNNPRVIIRGYRGYNELHAYFCSDDLLRGLMKDMEKGELLRWQVNTSDNQVYSDESDPSSVTSLNYLEFNDREKKIRTRIHKDAELNEWLRQLHGITEKVNDTLNAVQMELERSEEDIKI